MYETEQNTKDIDALERSRNTTELDDSLWNNKCNYTDIETCTNLNPNNYNLLMLQLNIRSLLAHQHELNQLLCTLEKWNSKIGILLLCETFLSENTMNMVKIPGYTHVGNTGKKEKKEVSLSLQEKESPTKKGMTLMFFRKEKLSQYLSKS